MFKFLKRKNKEIKELNAQVCTMKKEMDKLQNDYLQLKRIVCNSKQNEITYQSFDPYENWMPKNWMSIPIHFSDKDRKCTYIYKDFKEYRIKGLMLHDAKIECRQADNVFHITDKVYDMSSNLKICEYIVDLNTESFIQEK